MDATNSNCKADAARKLAKQLRANPKSATRTAGVDLVQQAMSGTSDTSAVLAKLQQIKASMKPDASRQRGSAGVTAEAPAGPTAAAVATPVTLQQQQQQPLKPTGIATTQPQQQQQRQVTTISSKPATTPAAAVDTHRPLQQQQQHVSPIKTPATTTLASATTSQGPIVMTNPEEVAQAQQALHLLNTYDFKIYGQGLSAGPTAVPLQPPGQKVLYKPEPVAPEPPLPPSVTAAAAPAAVDRKPALGTTPSGTPTVFMRPLPQDTAAAAAAAAATGSGAGNLHSHPAAADSGKPSSPVCMTLDAKLQQQQRNLEPSLRRRKKESPSAYYTTPVGTERRVVTSGTTAASSSSSSSSSRRGGIGSRISSWWARTKVRIVEAVEDAGAWLLHMLMILGMWLLKMLMIPIRAIFGPWYQYNRELKERQHELLAEQRIDLSELHDALGALPSWLSGVGGATEKLTWLNELLAQIWPVLDPVVCQLIRSSVEPMLDDMKPPFIAAMGFQKFTLGELPCEFEGIRVVGGAFQGATDSSGSVGMNEQHALAAAAADDDGRIELEVDFRWVGEPNISFFVELAVAGPYTRMVPKVSHLTARGTLRLGLARLVPHLPGFGALLISMARTPQVKFSLDFGPALGGKFTAKPVAAFLDPFIRDTLANLLVWPNRFVIPLLPRNVTGNLDDLTLHSVGVLEVEVLSARHLPKKGGAFSTVDPQVELWTQPQHHVFTSVKKSSRNPNWRNQRHELLVQEPDSQMLRIILNDIDMLNVKELLRVNLLKGAANLLRSARPIGRTALPLRDICNEPFKRHQLELRLSGSEWTYELGVLDEDDDSTLKLAVMYKPFQDLDAASTKPISARGVLFVMIRQCEDLASGDYRGGSSDPYVLCKIAGQKKQTAVLQSTTSPVYNSYFEFFNVQTQDALTVQVWDKDTLKPDDLLGQVELPVTAIVDWSQGGKRGWRDGWWKLRGGRKGQKDGDFGRIEMKVQFRPY